MGNVDHNGPEYKYYGKLNDKFRGDVTYQRFSRRDVWETIKLVKRKQLCVVLYHSISLNCWV